jgi:hypothetical protein
MTMASAAVVNVPAAVVRFRFWTLRISILLVVQACLSYRQRKQSGFRRPFLDEHCLKAFTSMKGINAARKSFLQRQDNCVNREYGFGLNLPTPFVPSKCEAEVE